MALQSILKAEGSGTLLALEGSMFVMHSSNLYNVLLKTVRTSTRTRGSGHTGERESKRFAEQWTYMLGHVGWCREGWLAVLAYIGSGYGMGTALMGRNGFRWCKFSRTIIDATTEVENVCCRRCSTMRCLPTWWGIVEETLYSDSVVNRRWRRRWRLHLVYFLTLVELGRCGKRGWTNVRWGISIALNTRESRITIYW